MNDEQAEILSTIEAAFGRTPPPAARDIPRKANLEAIQVKNFFAGKPWWEITMQSLMQDYVGDASACLTFMAPQARFYYLPTYLAIAVKDYLEADMIAASLPNKLIACIEQEDLDLPHSIQSLSEDQHRAIAATLRYISDNFESGFGPLDKAKYALDLYWSRYLD